MKKVVITGGHHNSALVVAECLRKRGADVLWFGHKFTMLGDKKPGAEFREVTKSGFSFVNIKAGKLSQRNKLVYLLRIPVGFFQSFYYLVYFRPNLVFSFGGYLAVPVVVCGWLLRIPVVTHEQTVVSGLANRLISFFARKIFVSWSTSITHFPKGKAIHTGLPLRKEIFKDSGKIKFSNKLPTIYITGGKQGAHLINMVVKKLLPEWLEKYNVIHQCGSTTVHNDFMDFKLFRDRLSSALSKRYIVFDYIFQDKIGSVFATCDLVVSRSGAHITYELAVLGKPALLIPIPWSRSNEQMENAKMLKKVGLAEILSQSELMADVLKRRVETIMTQLEDYKKNGVRAKKLVKRRATSKIVDLALKL